VKDPSNWIIVDLDGTLCDARHRLHFLRDGDKPNWDGFNSACINDSLIAHVALLVKVLFNAGWKVALMTGRSEDYKEQTTNWLRNHSIPYNQLLMRASGDYRSDTEVKQELYQYHFVDRRTIFILEDRDKVVEMWRSIGVPCYQVQKGEY
jgi:uncharacterized HAD superfamily protein